MKITTTMLLLFSYSCANNSNPKILIPTPKTEVSVDAQKVANAQKVVNTQKTVNRNTLSYVSQMVNEKKIAWLKSPSRVPPLAFKKPIKIKYNKPSVLLLKGEFETTKGFKKRVLVAQKQQLNDKQQLDSQYQANMRKYNDALKKYQLTLKEEFDERLKVMEALYPNYMQESILNTFGRPTLKNIQYNADIKRFFATLISENNSFKEFITFYMPLDEARNFKKLNQKEVKVEVRFHLNKKNNVLSLSHAELFFNNKTYIAKIINQTDILEQQKELAHISSDI